MNSRPTPWRCWPWGRSGTPPRRPGGGQARHRRPGAGQEKTPGEEPGRTPETGAGPRLLESLDETVREARLLRRYYIRQGSLHGECFCNGLCDPIEDTGAGPARRPAASTMPSAWRQWTSLYAALKGPTPRSWRSCCWTSRRRPGTRRRSQPHRNPEVDRLVSEIHKRIMRRVGELAGASGIGSSQ